MRNRLFVVVDLLVVLARHEGFRWDDLVETGSSSVRHQQWVEEYVKSGLMDGVKEFTLGVNGPPNIPDCPLREDELSDLAVLAGRAAMLTPVDLALDPGLLVLRDAFRDLRTLLCFSLGRCMPESAEAMERLMAFDQAFEVLVQAMVAQIGQADESIV